MRRRWRELGVVLVLLAALGFAVAASGIVSIEASSGHWGVTAWFLQFSKERSVATHTIGADALALDEPWLVLKGAGHYHAGCLPCHGGPDRAFFAPIAQAMTPVPPDLGPLVGAWDPEELFYIVKHGIKLTGMPAWPSQHRDDEVRAMVAFLLALPELEPEAYRRLVHGDVERELAALGGREVAGGTAPAALVACARCHGVDGNGRGSAAFPKLAGQRPEYLAAALRAFARGERHSGIMKPFAAVLSEDEIQALADWYGGRAVDEPRVPPRDTVDVAAAIERGRRIAFEGIPVQRVPTCVTCHGPGAEDRNPAYPDLAGQYADYLVLQLELFAAEQRGGSPFAHVMSAVAQRLTHEQMQDVAAYYASLHPGRDR